MSLRKSISLSILWTLVTFLFSSCASQTVVDEPGPWVSFDRSVQKICEDGEVSKFENLQACKKSVGKTILTNLEKDAAAGDRRAIRMLSRLNGTETPLPPRSSYSDPQLGYDIGRAASTAIDAIGGQGRYAPQQAAPVYQPIYQPPVTRCTTKRDIVGNLKTECQQSQY